MFRAGFKVKSILQSPFHKKASTIKIPLKSKDKLPVSVLFTKEPIIYQEIEHSEEKTDNTLKTFLNSDHFAIIPIMMKDTSVGVLIVDNYFNHRKIVQEQVNILQIVVNQGALAIANARFFDELTQALGDLQEAQEELVKKEKMAVLGEISAGVAHDIRNPLMAIGGFARRLKKKIGDDKYLDIIIHESTRLEHLLTDILIYSKEVVLECSLIHLQDLFQESISIVKQAKPVNNIETIIEGADITIYVDNDKLQQVLISVMINAVEAMEKDGGRLRIRWKTVPEKNYVYIYIEDTGVGVNIDDVSKLFIPFYTKKSSGTGLGLAIADKIIKAHKGLIRFDTPVDGYSTCCTIALPIQKNSITAPAIDQS